MKLLWKRLWIWFSIAINLPFLLFRRRLISIPSVRSSSVPNSQRPSILLTKASMDHLETLSQCRSEMIPSPTSSLENCSSNSSYFPNARKYSTSTTYLPDYPSTSNRRRSCLFRTSSSPNTVRKHIHQFCRQRKIMSRVLDTWTNSDNLRYLTEHRV